MKSHNSINKLRFKFVFFLLLLRNGPESKKSGGKPYIQEMTRQMCQEKKEEEGTQALNIEWMH